jgi:glucose-1-phosphate cytidylyltransferase
VLSPAFFDYVPGDVTLAKPLEALAAHGQLVAYRHEGFWQCMDTLRDKIYLNMLWERGEAPWKTWP